MSLQRLKCTAYNRYADKAFVNPATTTTDYAAIVILCELSIIGHQHKKLSECLPCEVKFAQFICASGSSLSSLIQQYF